MTKPSPVADFFSRVFAILVAAAILVGIWFAMQPSEHDLRMRALNRSIVEGEAELERLDRVLERMHAENPDPR